ncbi:hypothetical protein [Streptomyces atroolivaceus]|uniref:Uncharacterized protein n=1 Tax=Streptomyces atroolivaceus TaxID=66869 RepID=A0ABV9VL64_STRAZ|nr:hypothetical protein [Streptomyces atroolivaceus]
MERPDRTPPEHPLHRPPPHPRRRARHRDRRRPSAVTAARNEVSTTDASLLPTALRILGALRTGPAPVPATAGAVVDCAPAAIGYVDDFDLPPLTDPDFTDHIRTLIATDTTPTRIRNRLQPRPKASKPLTATARHRTWAWG